MATNPNEDARMMEERLGATTAARSDAGGMAKVQPSALSKGLASAEKSLMKNPNLYGTVMAAATLPGAAWDFVKQGANDIVKRPFSTLMYGVPNTIDRIASSDAGQAIDASMRSTYDDRPNAYGISDRAASSITNSRPGNFMPGDPTAPAAPITPPAGPDYSNIPDPQGVDLGRLGGTDQSNIPDPRGDGSFIEYTPEVTQGAQVDPLVAAVGDERSFTDRLTRPEHGGLAGIAGLVGASKFAAANVAGEEQRFQRLNTATNTSLQNVGNQALRDALADVDKEGMVSKRTAGRLNVFQPSRSVAEANARAATAKASINKSNKYKLSEPTLPDQPYTMLNQQDGSVMEFTGAELDAATPLAQEAVRQSGGSVEFGDVLSKILARQRANLGQ